MKPAARILVVALAALASSCIMTIEESMPAGWGDATPIQAEPTRAWLVFAEDERIGAVLRFEPENASERFFYSVRNVHHQDLGIVDALGRAFRRRPHREEPEWIGSGTVTEGVERVLDAQGDVELRETPVEALIELAKGETAADSRD